MKLKTPCKEIFCTLQIFDTWGGVNISNIFFSESGIVAYQNKGNEMYYNMQGYWLT